ncbi:PorT family protein [Crocinitomicaceae bacterium]|nr:PorT family protein [Crocinitomicaceae bacterium]
MKKQYQIDLFVLSSMKIVLLFCIGLSFSSYAQKEKSKNYRKFDDKLLHFGFMLGGNTADFTAYQKLNTFELYGLKSLENKSAAGGQVGIVTTLKVGTPVVRLRFIPTLSFQERILQYTFVNPDTTSSVDIFNEERVNSTNLDFPLMWQFRTIRHNNFASYVLLGGQYSLDLQSQEDASQDFIDPFIKIKRHDFQAQLGLGVEFFAPYFKFGMEVKYSHGLINSFIQDNTPSSDPVQKLYNKVWWFSIIFEG